MQRGRRWEDARRAHTAHARQRHPTDAPDPDARPQDFVLANTGRFQHSPRYVERLAAELGFAVARGEDIVPRQEAREPVDGRLYVLVKS